MKVQDFKAEPNVRGGRIDLYWVNPSAAEFPAFQRIRILRRELTQPKIGLAGGLITIESPSVEIYNRPGAPGQAEQFSDTGLKSDTIYYYLIVALGPDPQPSLPVEVTASALATTSWQTADELYRRLPALYHRFDLILPPQIQGLEAGLEQKGQLRRLIEMFGLQFDLQRSFADGTRDFSDVERIEGVLLPLLAEWIGWPTDFSLPYAGQRNEIRSAPHYFRTTGIAANLQATINRLTKTDWKPQIKEFVHNVFLSNAPEQLYVSEAERRDPNWPASNNLKLKPVTLDVAYEGRPFAVRETDERDWLFYHARQSGSRAITPDGQIVSEDQWHLWLKIFERGEWLSARRLDLAGEVNKYPVMVRGQDGNGWLFYGSFQPKNSERVAEIRLLLFDAGQAALPAQLRTTTPGPFNFTDGEPFRLTIQAGPNILERLVTLRSEHFPNIANAKASELVALFEREIPGVRISLEDDGNGNGPFTITTLAKGATVTLAAPPSPVATKLGTLTIFPGRAASPPVQINGARNQPFVLADEDTLLIKTDSGPAARITFKTSQFANIAAATVQEVVNAINSVLPGVAEANGTRIRLKSTIAGEQSSIAVDVSGSKAATKLGFGVPLPGTALQFDDTEPAAFTDNANRIWLFWSSRRNGRWQIWYNRFNGTNWGTPKPLTSGIDADREPAVVFDRGGGGANQGVIHVFWSSRRNGRWNIRFRTTTKLDFDTLVDGDWAEAGLTPLPTDHDRQEPAAILLGPNSLELYFSSNQTDGRQIWMVRLTSAPPAALAQTGGLAQITTGQFTHRAPFAVKTNQGARLWFRGNESQTYTSPFYPAAKTLDARYAGSTTADTQNAAKLAQRKLFDDVLRYSYDTGKGQDNWYARDTVGVFFTPDITVPQVLEQRLKLIADVLRSVLPIQVRAVFIEK